MSVLDMTKSYMVEALPLGTKPRQILTNMFCAGECGRGASMSSKLGFAEFCCSECAERKEHKKECTHFWNDETERIVTRLEIGDKICAPVVASGEIRDFVAGTVLAVDQCEFTVRAARRPTSWREEKPRILKGSIVGGRPVLRADTEVGEMDRNIPRAREEAMKSVNNTCE